VTFTKENALGDKDWASAREIKPHKPSYGGTPI